MTTLAVSPAETNTRLAVDRTRLAYERTMMAWVRTATALISFGFTIYKFFQMEVGPQGLEKLSTARMILGPRGLGLVMISTGLLALLLGTVEHVQATRTMRATYGPQPLSVAAIVAGLVTVLGLLAFTAVLLRA